MTGVVKLEPVAGMLVAKRQILRPGDRMDVYMFHKWADVPASPIGGRAAVLTWCYNGTRSSAWEADMVWNCPECTELLDDRESGCDYCIAFTEDES